MTILWVERVAFLPHGVAAGARCPPAGGAHQSRGRAGQAASVSVPLVHLALAHSCWLRIGAQPTSPSSALSMSIRISSWLPVFMKVFTPHFPSPPLLLTAKLLERANLLPVFLECSRAPQAFHPTPQLQGEGSPCTPRREAQRSDAAPSGGSAVGRGPSGAACTLREGRPDCRRCPSFLRIVLESSRAAGRHSDPVGRRQACHERGLCSPSPRARSRRAP